MRSARSVLSAAASLSLLVALTACGGSGSPSTGSDSAEPSVTDPTDALPGVGGGDFPGAIGEVAAVDGRTAQVQNEQTGQVAVTWTGTTDFTATVDAALADLSVGDCVVVTGDGDEAIFNASTIQISDPTDDGCQAGPGGGGMGGGRQEPPEGAPSPGEGETPEGTPEGDEDMGGVMPPGRVIGEVTAMHATGFTVVGMAGGADTGEEADVETTVSVSGDTSYTETQDATAKAVTVGSCVSAMGEADDVGAVTAESISISDPVHGSCGFPFGGGRS
jgi:hypothetical protein